MIDSKLSATKSQGETAISKAIRDAIERLGFIVTRVQTGTFRGAGGYVKAAKRSTPDLIITASRGRTIYMEVKRPGENPTPAQLLWHSRARALGHTVVTVHSVAEAMDAVR